MSLNYTDLSNRIKLLAHPERLRILDALRRDAECVCHLETMLGKPQPYVSQQLRVLRKAGVIADEKQGQNVFYRLHDPEIIAWLDTILGDVDHEPTGMQARRVEADCICPKCRPQLPAAAVIDIRAIENVK